MNRLLMIASIIVLTACGRNYNVAYTPNPPVNDPGKVIERVIRQQPPNYTHVPYDVIVKSDCIEFKSTEYSGLVFKRYPGEIVTTICFNNIGKVILNKADIWYAEILDRQHAWIYYVWSYDETEAKVFIDAMYTMMQRRP